MHHDRSPAHEFQYHPQCIAGFVTPRATQILASTLPVLPILLVAILSLSIAGHSSAGEFIFDESITDVQPIGMSEFHEVIVDEQFELFDESGEISTGQLDALFSQRGISTDQAIMLRFNGNEDITGALNSIELKMGVENGERSFSIEKIKFNNPAHPVNNLLPFTQQTAPATQPKDEASAAPAFSLARMAFVTLFAGFWIALFAVLFWITAPRQGTVESNSVASVAS